MTFLKFSRFSKAQLLQKGGNILCKSERSWIRFTTMQQNYTGISFVLFLRIIKEHYQ